MSLHEGALERSEWVGGEAGERRKRSPNECWQSLGWCECRMGGVQSPAARAGVSAVSLQAGKQCWALWSGASVEPAGLQLQWHTPSCGRKGQVPAQTSVASCFLCSLVCLAHSRVISEHPSLRCTTCAFLHLPLSSFCLSSAWICSVCLANSKISPYLNLVLSVFGLYFTCGL